MANYNSTEGSPSSSTTSFKNPYDDDDSEKDIEAGYTETTELFVAGVDDHITPNGNVITEAGEVVIIPSDSDDEGSKEAAKNIFKDPDVAAYYRDLYDQVQYECRHAFDPDFEWTAAEEAQVKWKIEIKVCLWACIMFSALQLDRGNITQALSDTFLQDLGLTTNDYNLGQTLFHIAFLTAELPSQLVSKRMGPDRWIPLQITLWSLVSVYQCRLSGRFDFLLTRVLLGVLEGGFIPDIVLWLSYFYTSKELPVRLSFFWSAMTITQIVASLLAFGILHLGGTWGWAGWRWLFFLEGGYSLLIGFIAFFNMPPSPVETRSWYRPEGWFTHREEKIVVNRVLRDDPSKGDMHNREAIDLKLLWQSLMDFDIWPLYLIGLISYIPTSTISSYLTIVLKDLGFNTFNTNLLTIPPSVFHIIILLIQTWITERFDERSLICTLQPLWLLPCFAVLIWWRDAMVSPWQTYFVLVILLSTPYIHAILVGWCSKNSNTVRSRTISASLYSK